MKECILKHLVIIMTVALLCCGCGNGNTVNEDATVSDNTEAVETEDESEDADENSEEYSSDDEDVSDTEDVAEASQDEDATDDESEDNSEEVEVTNEAETGTPVENHGRLSVKGTQLVDKNGDAYQLRGVSTHGIGWFPEYVNYDAFKTLRDEWGVNCIRLAMYTDEYNGYCSGGNKDELKNIVMNGVSYATDLGMYVIIDWHILHDLDPNKYKSDAKNFFEEMSKKYADYDNVIFEICNEPNGGTSWSSIKSYAEEVIPIIRANTDAIILIGTPNWCQDVDVAANDPVKGYDNLMYTIHFYADTHKDSYRRKMDTAISKGLPLFCSEFGITDASGNGACNQTEADKWISAMNGYGMSYCIWNLSNKNESSSLISSGCSKLSGWAMSDISEEGKWYIGVLGGEATGNTANNTSNNTESTSSQNNNNSDNNSGSSASSANGNLNVDVTPSGNWNDGNNDFYQYTINLSAKGGNVNNWKITVSFNGSVSIDQSWSGNFSANGSSIVITPVDYNKEIASGQSAEIGFIVKTNGNPGTPTVSIN